MERDYLKAPFYVRWAARVVAWWIVGLEIPSFQCVGKKNWDLGSNKVDIQCPTSVALWFVLRYCGYMVCEADVMQYYCLGDPDLKEIAGSNKPIP